MSNNDNTEDEAFARDLFDTSDQDFTRNLITAGPEPSAPGVVSTEGGNPGSPRTPDEQESRQFMADLLGTPDADNLPDYQ